MFTQSFIALFAVFMPFHHAQAVPIVAPVAIVAPAPVVVTHATPATVEPSAPATQVAPPKPQAVEGPQPVGPSQTLAPLPNRCEINWQGTTTQTDGTSSQTATSSGSFSMPCDQTWDAPAGVTYTSTPIPSSDSVTTGSAS